MEAIDETTPPANRLAIASLVSALLTVLSFCIGAAPIPLTGWVCFPAALLLGATALGSGAAALHSIRQSGEGGRWMALVGVWLGGLTMLAMLCLGLVALVVAGLVGQIWIEAQP